MAEKQEKDFMSTKIIKHLFLIVGLSITIFCFESCRKQVDENMVPNVPVNIRINMDLPLYFNLRFPGNFVYLNGGNKGITLFHGFDGEFYATDRMCPYQPFDECSRVELDSGFMFRCGSMQGGIFEKCCESLFQYDGFLSNGPAIYGLRRYNVFRGGNILDITN
jgi:hypothetical protein